MFSKIIFSLLFTLVAFSCNAEKYVVKKGDTLQKIAIQHKIHVYQLRAENGMTSEDSIINPGLVLKIPKPEWKPFRCKASWYGKGFFGKPTASGIIYTKNSILVAHRHLPLYKYVKVKNLDNGKFVVAVVLDRGPYAKDKDGHFKRCLDLSPKIAEYLGAIEPGEIPVEVTPLDL